MNNTLGIQCLTLELQDYNQKQIADKLNIDQSTVSRQIKKITTSREFQIGVITINEFFTVFKKCEEYWNQSNKDYRDLIDQVKEIENKDEFNEGATSKSFHNSKYDKMMAKIELISKLKEKQDKNMERILNLAKQGEVVLALKAARDILSQHAPNGQFIIKELKSKSDTLLNTAKQLEFKEVHDESSND